MIHINDEINQASIIRYFAVVFEIFETGESIKKLTLFQGQLSIEWKPKKLPQWCVFINFDIVVELRLKMKQNENILKRCN